MIKNALFVVVKKRSEKVLVMAKNDGIVRLVRHTLPMSITRHQG